MMRSEFWIIAILAVFCTVSACQSPEHAPDATDGPPRAPADSVSAPEQVFEATGRIDTIVPNRKHVVLAHGDIPGFMDAMTMPFRVADTSVVTGLQKGDSVSFTVRVAGPLIEITHMEPVEP